MEEAVIVAEQWLQQTTDESAGRASNAYIRVAEARAQMAQEDYQHALKGNAKVPNAISKIEMERLRLGAELARLRLAKANALDPTLPNEILHYQIGELRQDVLKLQLQVAEQWEKK